MRLTRSLFALAVVCALPILRAQAPVTAPSPPLKLGKVTVTGSLRSRVYFWAWFAPTAGNNNYQYSGNLFRVALSQTRGTWDWNAEFAVPFLLGLPSTATGTGAQQGALGLGGNYFAANSASQNAAMVFPKQLYVRFDGLGGNKEHTFQIGRFEFMDGGEIVPKSATLATVKRGRVFQRLIGNFGFSDVGRSFDGVHYTFAGQNHNFTFVGAMPTRGVYQVDGWGRNRVAFGYSSYTRKWGSRRHAADTRAFFIEYDDFRHIVKTDNRALAIRRGDFANIRIETVGGHTLHAFESGSGTLDLLLWGAVQTGCWGVQKQRAGAFATEGGFQPKIWGRVKPWVRGGFTYGSGDGNPNDNQHATFFQLLPTTRLYARFPFFNMMNTEQRFGTMLLRPHPKVTISSEFHALRLSNPNDLWYSGGGAFQPWTFGYTGRATSGRRSLANLYDTGVDYRLNRKLTLTGYTGYTQGLAVMEKIYPKGKDGRFGYLEFLQRF